MQLVTLQARSLPEAMRRMRQEAGVDAMLMSSRETEDGVAITVAVPGSADEDLGALLDGGTSSEARETVDAALIRHAVPSSVAERMREELGQVQLSDAEALLASGLARRLRFAPLGLSVSGALALVGPTGGGKTAAVARLAASVRLAGRKVAVLTTDGDRAGSLAQLQALLAPLGIQPEPVRDATELRQRCDELVGTHLVLIDTSGVNPFRGADMTSLAALIGDRVAEPVLVLPAGLDAHDTIDTAARFASLGVRRMLVTKLDAARRLGGILAAADAGLALAEASVSPLIGRAMPALTPVGLARLLLRAGVAGGEMM